MTGNWSVRKMATALLTTALVGAMAVPALGQRDGRRGGPGGGGGFREMREPAFMRRDLPVIVDELDLDDDQTTIAEVLLLDYEAAFADASEKLRERFEQVGPQTPEAQARRVERRALMDEFRAIRDEFRALREKAGEDGEIDRAARDRLRERMEPLRERMVEMREQRPQGAEREQLMNDRAEIGRAWRTEYDAMRAEFLVNVQSILAEDQIGLWPAFERTVRREKTLGRGRLSGERVNLLHLLRELDLSEDERAALADVTEAYVVALDQTLVARNAAMDEALTEFSAAMRSEDFAHAAVLAARDAERRVAVRDVNEQYAELFAAALAERSGPESARAFEDAYRRRAYTRIYRPTRMERTFDAARALEGLDPEVREAIVVLGERYAAELDEANRQLVRVTRDEEPLQMQRRFQRRAARAQGIEREREDDRIRVGYRERGELDRRYRAELETLLLPEQIEQLPPPPAGRDRDGGGWWGDAGDRGGWGRGGSDRARGEARRRAVEQFDRDGDGELNAEERRAARAARDAGSGGRNDDGDTPD